MFLLSPTHFATKTESTKDPQTVSLFSIIFFSNTNVKTAPPTLSLAPAAKERKQKKERKKKTGNNTTRIPARKGKKIEKHQIPKSSKTPSFQNNHSFIGTFLGKC
jgi:hypothetical protein